MITLFPADNLTVLKTFEADKFDLIYLDPPFNTGHKQNKTTLSVKQSDGKTQDRAGFGDRRYTTTEVSKIAYEDNFENYTEFLFPRVEELKRVLKPTGSILLHCDSNESHYIKIFLDRLFGRENFRNEIIWHWDYGAKSKNYWPKKHNSIFWYTKSDQYHFDIYRSDRLDYMAPGLVGPEKAKEGKLPTDTWFISIVGTNSLEKTGYPTQKPLKLLRRLINCHSKPGDLLLDPFAGSGSFGDAAQELNRDCYLIENNPPAIEIIRKRLLCEISPI